MKQSVQPASAGMGKGHVAKHPFEHFAEEETHDPREDQKGGGEIHHRVCSNLDGLNRNIFT